MPKVTIETLEAELARVNARLAVAAFLVIVACGVATALTAGAIW